MKDEKRYKFVRQLYHRNGVVCSQYGEERTKGVVQMSNTATNHR